MNLPPLPESMEANAEGCAMILPPCQPQKTVVFDTYTPNDMQAYGQQCALAERERILKIAYEQSTAYGKTGECMWIGIKSHARYGK